MLRRLVVALAGRSQTGGTLSAVNALYTEFLLSAIKLELGKSSSRHLSFPSNPRTPDPAHNNQDLTTAILKAIYSPVQDSKLSVLMADARPCGLGCCSRS